MRKTFCLTLLSIFLFVISIVLISTAPTQAQGPIIGEIRIFSGDDVPDGWFLCDGACISTTVYSELYAVIGEYYDDGITCSSGYVQIPALIGRFPMGTNTIPGIEGGESDHALTTGEIPSHKHPMCRSVTKYLQSGVVVGYPGHAGGGEQCYGEETELTGGGQAHNNMPPYLTISYIIAYTTTNITPTPTTTPTITPTPTSTPIVATPVISVYTYTLDSGTILTVPAQITTGQIIESSVGLALLAVFILMFTFRLVHR